VGADDCFVMYDKWVQTKSRLPRGADACQVAAKCYWDATWSMALTSLTTCAAFLSTAVVPIAPIRVFALFMGAMIIFDYLYDITVFASLLAFQHRLQLAQEAHLDAGGAPGCAMLCLDFWGWLEARKKLKVRAAGQEGTSSELQNKVQVKYLEASAVGGGGDAGVQNTPLSERVFRDRVYPVLHAARWPLVVVLAAMACTSTWAAAKLEPPEDNAVALLREDHPMERYDKLSRTVFMNAEEASVMVRVVWGIVPLDVGDGTEDNIFPPVRLDTAFDPSPPANQEWLVSFCDDVRAKVASETGGYDCMMSDFRWWLSEAGGGGDGEDGEDGEMVAECGGGDVSRVKFPVAAENFQSCALLWARRERPGRRKNFYMKNGGGVGVILIQASFTAKVSWTEKLETLRGEYDRWEAAIGQRMASAPAGVGGGWQTAEAWWWMDTISHMRDGAYSAAGITLLLSAVIILLSTRNVVVTVFSVGAISAILAATVATVVGMGWTLGFLEGICFSILIGLSVDFVIHVGHAYVQAGEEYDAEGGQEEPDRNTMARAAVSRMGFPVVSAGLTTLMSAIILFFCTISFFVKFGTIVMLSMVYALVITFGLYAALLDAAGPQRGFGDVARMSRAVCGGGGGKAAVATLPK